jgi:hypothetical protein
VADQVADQVFTWLSIGARPGGRPGPKPGRRPPGRAWPLRSARWPVIRGPGIARPGAWSVARRPGGRAAGAPGRGYVSAWWPGYVSTWSRVMYRPGRATWCAARSWWRWPPTWWPQLAGLAELAPGGRVCMSDLVAAWCLHVTCKPARSWWRWPAGRRPGGRPPGSVARGPRPADQVPRPADQVAGTTARAAWRGSEGPLTGLQKTAAVAGCAGFSPISHGMFHVKQFWAGQA